MPATAEKIWQVLGLPGSVAKARWDEAVAPLEAGHKIGKPEPLFKKIDVDETKLEEMLQKIREENAKMFRDAKDAIQS
jgi:methionyl-tRNA synthetase